MFSQIKIGYCTQTYELEILYNIIAKLSPFNISLLSASGANLSYKINEKYRMSRAENGIETTNYILLPFCPILKLI